MCTDYFITCSTLLFFYNLFRAFSSPAWPLIINTSSTLRMCSQNFVTTRPVLAHCFDHSSSPQAPPAIVSRLVALSLRSRNICVSTVLTSTSVSHLYIYPPCCGYIPPAIASRPISSSRWPLRLFCCSSSKVVVAHVPLSMSSSCFAFKVSLAAAVQFVWRY